MGSSADLPADFEEKIKLSTIIKWICATTIFLSACPASFGADSSLSKEQVRAELEDVLETLANRQLTAEELDAVTAEYIPLFGDTVCREECAKNVRWNAEKIARLKKNKGKPVEASIRHRYISNTYFSPTQSGSLIQRIIAEPDPILVVEPLPPRLMTRKDVIAAMNLFHFARESGPPRAKRFSETDIAAAADSLNKIYPSKLHVMPRHLPLAAVYWTGIQQEWAGFSEQERANVRAYFAEGNKIQDPLSSRLYAALLGLSQQQAKKFHTDEFFNVLRDSASYIAMQAAITSIKIQTYSQYWTPYR